MSNWFQRMTQGILTSPGERKEIPANLWYKCPKCKNISPRDEHDANLGVCQCGFHERISSKKYFEILFDNNEYKLLDEDLFSGDPLNFVDRKRYTDRLIDAHKKTGLRDALTNAVGKIDSMDLVVSSMNFEFIGGSMGSVVGEKIARAINYCIKKQKHSYQKF